MKNITIEKLGINGEGVARVNGKVLFVKGALSGEVANVSVIKDYENYAVCELTDIITRSEFRQIPLCPYYDSCGGCQLQHLKYEKQLEFKKNLIEETFLKIANEKVIVNFPIYDKEYNYRNKVVFAFDKNKNILGLKQENSHKIVEINECKISNPLINKILNLFKKALLEKSSKNTNFIRYLAIRIVNNLALITVVVEKEIRDFNLFVNLLKQNNIKYSLFLNINKNSKNILSNKTIYLFGEKLADDEINGIKYFITPNSFMQVNSAVQSKLYDYLVNAISKDDAVVNCYSGAGLLSALIAKKAKQVLGIEIERTSSKSADRLAKENNIKNLVNICGDVKVVLKDLKQRMATKDITIVLDPPRSGCDKQVLATIKDIEPKSIYYVSCNPRTLARDYSLLKDKYKISFVQPFDMFPNTVHIESLVYFLKKGEKENE